jgi:RNA polymerase sigma factor (sigma-70 family)
VAAFFVSGITALAGMLAGIRLWLIGGSRRQPIRTLAALAHRGLAHRPGRPLAVATIVGVAQFLIVAVSAFALRPPADPGDRRSPTGGWTSLVTFGEPTTLDPLAPAARERLGLSPQEALDQSQRVLAIEQAISALPERQSAALTLCALQGHSQAEAAEIMDVSVEALESLLARARRTLRAHLLERSPSP